MKKLAYTLLILLLLPTALFAQKKKKYNEGSAPKVSIYEVTKDSLVKLQFLPKNHETRIKVVLEGGMENIKNSMFVTSKQAVITKVASGKHEYFILPQDDVVEIIVDVQTFEIYYGIKETEVNGKIKKEAVKEYPPKTYMVGYERYNVR